MNLTRDSWMCPGGPWAPHLGPWSRLCCLKDLWFIVLVCEYRFRFSNYVCKSRGLMWLFLNCVGFCLYIRVCVGHSLHNCKTFLSYIRQPLWTLYKCISPKHLWINHSTLGLLHKNCSRNIEPYLNKCIDNTLKDQINIRHWKPSWSSNMRNVSYRVELQYFESRSVVTPKPNHKRSKTWNLKPTIPEPWCPELKPLVKPQSLICNTHILFIPVSHKSIYVSRRDLPCACWWRCSNGS